MFKVDLVSSEREKFTVSSVIGYIKEEVGKAARPGAMAPISFRVLNFKEGTVRGEWWEEYWRQQCCIGGLSGRIIFFTRDLPGGGYRPLPIGVPVAITEGKKRSCFALYVPSIEDTSKFPTSQSLQNWIDQRVADFCQRNPGSGFAGDILVVTGELVAFWEKRGGIWGIDERVLDPENAQKSLNLLKERQEEGEKFFWGPYFQALSRALFELLEKGMTPADIVRDSGRPESVLWVINGTMSSVNFSGLVNTGHSSGLRTWVLERDGGICHFPGCSSRVSPCFTVEELIRLDKMSCFRASRDPKRELMGVDEYADPWKNEAIEDCGTFLRGRYSQILPATRQLEDGQFELHHIIPRGAAYTALLTAILKGHLVGNESPEEMIFYLRAVKVRNLVADKIWQEAGKGRREILEALQEHILAIDRAVNSPFNLMVLCPGHHRLIHPDMNYGGQLALLFRLVNNGSILAENHSLVNFRESIRKVLAGAASSYEVDYGERMEAIKLARRLVLAQRRPYWSGEKADWMLDYARMATRRVIERGRSGWLDKVIQEGNCLPSDLGEDEVCRRRHELWLKATGGPSEPFFPQIRRRTDRLEAFRRWLKE